jgi:hypothetical protein
MQAKTNTTLRALRDLALLAGAGLAAASLWAGGLQQGYIVEADTWQQEVQHAGTAPWPQDGWYRLVPQQRALEVRAVKPTDSGDVPANALYLHLPGAPLMQGLRPVYASPSALQQPEFGQDYELAFAGKRFALRVDDVAKGMQYTIAYGGHTYTYVLGPFDATTTSVRLVADLDGDGQPDFLVQVDGTGYLLLSTRAVPGANLPAAELFASPDGC